MTATTVTVDGRDLPPGIGIEIAPEKPPITIPTDFMHPFVEPTAYTAWYTKRNTWGVYERLARISSGHSIVVIDERGLRTEFDTTGEGRVIEVRVRGLSDDVQVAEQYEQEDEQHD
jgi:hypothetical protein